VLPINQCGWTICSMLPPAPWKAGLEARRHRDHCGAGRVWEASAGLNCSGGCFQRYSRQYYSRAVDQHDRRRATFSDNSRSEPAKRPHSGISDYGRQSTDVATRKDRQAGRAPGQYPHDSSGTRSVCLVGNVLTGFEIEVITPGVKLLEAM
jgi:hypothetical protein